MSAAQQLMLDEPASAAAPDSPKTLEYLNRSARQCWQLLHGWNGPELGGLINFEDTFAEDVDGQNHYVSGGTARVIEMNETHCTAVSVGYTWTDYPAEKSKRKSFVPQRIPSHCNGKKFKLALYQIEPCHQLLHSGSVWIYEDGAEKHIADDDQTPITQQ